MFVFGCASPQAAPEEGPSPAPEPEEPVVSEPVEAAPEPEPEAEPEPQRQMTSKMQELVQKHVGRVDSLRYMYQDQTIKPEEWETWIKGDKMHVKLREMDNIRGDVYIDNVYLDLSSKTAVGYCERNVYRCADPNSPVEVNFRKYYRKTPFEWIDEVSYAEKVAEEQMQQRTVWKIRSVEDGKTTEMWVDEYYGIPLEIEVTEGGATNKYIFEDIGFNAVDDSDLEHTFVTVTYN